MKRIGYLVDLSSLKFDEGTSSWIQLMPLGTYDHPVYGTIEITPERCQRFATNVNSKVREVDLDIDYDHKMHSGEAAGWIKQAEARPDGLWGLVEWTPKAKDQIASRAYKYFSPEFVDEWKHPKSGVVYQDVLNGGGITNRPYLKDILPLNLSEYMQAGENNEGSRTVNPDQLKELAKLLGLPEDATGDQILGALQVKLGTPENQEQNQDGAQQGASGDADAGAAQGAQGADAGAAVAGAALSEDVLKLAESNPAIKALMDMVNTQGKQLEEQTKELNETRVNATIVKLSEAATKKGFALPPTSKEAIKVILSEPGMSRQLSEKIVFAFDKIIDNGLVELNERGNSRNGGGDSDSAVKRFNDEVTKISAERKIDYASAALAVSQEQPQLFSDYQTESYSGRE